MPSVWFPIFCVHGRPEEECRQSAARFLLGRNNAIIMASAENQIRIVNFLHKHVIIGYNIMEEKVDYDIR